MSGEFRVVASLCGSCGCGCPTIMDAGDDAVIVVGSTTNVLAHAAAVKGRTGEGEAAVVIPRSLLIEAAQALGLR